MKIIHVCSYFLPRLGGVERLMYYTAREQVRQGNDVTMITRKVPQDAKEYEVMDGIKIHRIKTNEKKPFFSSLLQTIKKIKELATDDTLINAHDWTPGLACLLAGKRYVMLIHGFGPWEKNPLAKKVSDTVCKNADAIMVNGPYIEKYRRFNPIYLREGVNIDEYKFRKIKNKNTILVVGRLSPERHIDIPIDGFKKLVDSGNKKLRMLIAGDGPIRAELEKQAEGYNQIKFLGFRKDINRLITNSTIVVATGPTAALEAMGVGRPIILTYELDTKNIEGPKIRKGDEFVKFVKMLLKSPQSYGNKNRKIVEQKYLIANVVKKMQQVYRKARPDLR